MNRNHSRDLQDLFVRLRRSGWHITLTRRGHYHCRGPNGKTVFCPSTPSDRRSLANVRGKFRRAGARL